ncbi:unnamed protein product [Phytophthora fragariaefolia]|uniref:Unnamed protein product n=1 Tax=Phytophthora fragariaefolia TaxID=1490495 RepID=A0A9W6TT00_9STRA|nr:unnamed protein product [Phytophthora fragariaefolia]
MQVIQGYIADNYIDEEFRVSAQIVRDIYNEYGVVVGCSSDFGNIVASYLEASDQAVYIRVGDLGHNSDATTPPTQYSNSQVSAALLLGLRDQYDETFGLSSTARRINTGIIQRPRRRVLDVNGSAPPRWMLKTSLSFQQSNLDRLAGLRLTRKIAGKKSAHLVARDYRSMLASSFDSFDSCRATWEADIQARQQRQRVVDTFSVGELAQYCLDLLISCVHGKQSVLTLREEISQELEDFEKLLALRILNIAVDEVVTVPTSELLHIMLKGNLDEEYIRHGLPTVLPIASINDKHELARKILYGYANAAYGDAFNLVCWSCLDVAENVTVEAARLLDNITRPTIDNDGLGSLFSSKSIPLQPAKKTVNRSSESLAARALYLLTGSQAVRFMQFLSKVAHFNKSIQKRVLAHLAPYADKYEMHRLACAVCSIKDFSTVSQLFEKCFSEDIFQSCASVWIQYKNLFGDQRSCSAINSLKVHSTPVETSDHS